MLAQMKPHIRMAWQGSVVNRGVTAVELLVTLAVVGVLAAVGVPMMADTIEKQRVIAAANEITGIFAFAKSQTAMVDTSVDVDINQKYDIASPEDVSCIAVSTQAMVMGCYCWLAPGSPCTRMINGKAVTFGTMLRNFKLPNTGTVKFDTNGTDWKTPGVALANRVAFSAKQSATGLPMPVQIRVYGRRGNTLNVVINQVGRVSVCSPDGRISGYAAC